QDAFENHHPEVSVRRRQRGFTNLVNETLRTESIADEICRRDHLQAVFAGELHQVGDPSHRSVFFHDLADNASWNQTGDACEIYRSFGLAGTYQNPSIACAKWKNMSGPREITRPRLGIDRGQDRLCTVVHRNSSRNISPSFNGNAERRAILRSVVVVGDHQRNVQLVETMAGHGKTDQTSAMGC